MNGPRPLPLLWSLAAALCLAACGGAGGPALSDADRLGTSVAEAIVATSVIETRAAEIAATQIAAQATAAPTAPAPTAEAAAPTAPPPSPAPEPTALPEPTAVPPPPQPTVDVAATAEVERQLTETALAFVDVPPTALPPTEPPPPPEAALEYVDVGAPGENGDFEGGVLITTVDGQRDGLPLIRRALAILIKVRLQGAERDGDGVESVNFSIVGPNGTVHERTERQSGYCSFGGGEPVCNLWIFPDHNGNWPDGTPVENGQQYTVNVQINPEDPNRTGANWNADFVIDLS